MIFCTSATPGTPTVLILPLVSPSFPTTGLLVKSALSVPPLLNICGSTCSLITIVTLERTVAINLNESLKL